jgi:hypothetical protein
MDKLSKNFLNIKYKEDIKSDKFNINHCNKWKKNKYINPLNSKDIHLNDIIYKAIKKKCYKLNDEKFIKLHNINISHCNKWEKKKYINPLNQTKIKHNSDTYKQFKRICKILKSPISSSITLIEDKLEPYNINLKYNIKYRSQYYKILHDYIKKINIKNTNNCIKYKHIDNKSLYIIGNRIILEQKIGTPSKNGSIYLSYYRSSKKSENPKYTLGYFTVKIFKDNRLNRFEITVLNILTKIALKNECPHFPITYGTLECKDNTTTDNSINSSISTDNIKGPIESRLLKNNLLYQINEFADGDFFQFQEKNSQDELLILNAILQIYLSICFFHNKLTSYHADSHSGNFLYHKIKTGGYFYYKIYNTYYYIKNNGYLWVIWDFSFTNKIIDKNMTIVCDFEKIMKDLLRNNMLLYLEPEYKNILRDINTIIIKNPEYNSYDYTKIDKLQKNLLRTLIHKIPPSIITKIKPHDDEIINKTPYVLSDIVYE